MKVFAVLVVCVVVAALAGCGSSDKTFTAVPVGGKPASLTVEPLRAGPVTMKFADGELRYLQTGDGAGGNIETVRRVYFAVRDQRFDTPTPVFDKITVVRRSDSFTAEYAARVTHNNVEFAWTGQIEGKSDGTIVYTIDGNAVRDFASPRIGLNVLLGTPTYGGRTLEFTRLNKDESVSETFPKTPTSWDPGRFLTFNSDRSDGQAAFAATMDSREFGIEDQRQYGDSSFKAYGYLDLPFPNIAAGAKASQTLTLTFPDVKPVVRQPETTRITLGEPKDGAAIPVIRTANGPAGRTGDFNAAFNRAKRAMTSGQEFVWSFNPALHLNDADMLFENASAVAEQVAAMRRATDQAKLHITPITFQWPHSRPAPDGRAKEVLGAAWCVEIIRHLALSGADEATFHLMEQSWENSPAGDALKVWAGFSGDALKAHSTFADVRYILDYTTDSPGRCPVSVLAVNNNMKVRTIFLVNRTAQPQRVTFVQAVAKQAAVSPIQLGRDGWTSATKQGVRQSRTGAIRPNGRNVEVLVTPYAVVAFTLTNMEQ